MVKCRFRAGWTRKTAAESTFYRSFLFSVCVCVFMYVYVCVCVCESNSVPKRSKPFVASSMLFFLQGDTGSP